jgi:Fur family ferric uptake transcriptional regulator
VIEDELHDIVAGRLREGGHRYTAMRRRLIETLRTADRPMSVPDLVRGRRSPPQSSAYRNLGVLERSGLVRRVLTDEGLARYELTEELTEHHHHLICVRCGRIEDVAIPPGLERSIGRTLDVVGTEAGFATVSHRLDLIGRCRACVLGPVRE